MNIFFYWYLRIAYFFSYIYHIYFPAQQIQREPTILNKTDEYVKTRTEQFNKKKQNSSNIEPIFYKKDEFYAMIAECNNDIEEKWRTRVIFESSPRGNIVMYYDAYKHGFAYYSDTHGLPYKVLCAVAMKYVSVYFCRDFYIDNEGVGKDDESPMIDLYHREPVKPKDEMSKPVSDRSGPFAKLKNYNKPVRNTDKKQTNDLHEKESVNESVKVEYIRNKFISLGKIVNFPFIKREKKQLPQNGFKTNLLDGVVTESQLQKQVLNYKDFKSMQKTANPPSE
jgi:hypothetical protein